MGGRGPDAPGYRFAEVPFGGLMAPGKQESLGWAENGLGGVRGQGARI